MIKSDPIIAVEDVSLSSQWYKKVLGCSNMHGGEEFAVLMSSNSEVILCLHKWGEHDHPTMTKSNDSIGNGLILYFRAENLDEIRQNVKEMNYPVEKEIDFNPNSHKKEFSLQDPDGYYITISEYHNY